ncbi:uncharacterized protein B0I36DRAFT_340960 [Microdochium trichocladiopsis]|uniref:Uncharacterized protein n=1 Tax=Microdochium trichocladiopsis TaxID=1682393 RepID=A0A9P9BKQ0_9PEZI|nr:uncharacterized protein B0I36DRAFT_340960 [Microdochium trichocladiopsis]KAH7010774.1 hypothetical protein B0I36DRAFT_340960 [Microdochium trichocladiopsis]
MQLSLSGRWEGDEILIDHGIERVQRRHGHPSACPRARRKKLESVHFIPPVWSLATQKGVVDTAKRRERYCNDQNLGDWQTVLLEAGESIKSIAMDFLLWICERSAVRSYGTTWVYFRMYARPEKTGKRKSCMRDGRPGFFCVSPPDARVGTAAAAGA